MEISTKPPASFGQCCRTLNTAAQAVCNGQPETATILRNGFLESWRGMREVCSLIWLALVGAFRSRASLEAENTILRHQLNVLRRKSPKRPTFGMLDRLIFAGLYRLAPKVLGALAIVKPETVIKWHRAGFRSYWRWKSRRRGGRPTVAPEIRKLTRTFPAMVALGADSADSIGWRHAAGFGSVFLPLKSQRIVAPAGSERAVRKVLDGTDAADLMRCGCPICIRSATFRGRIGFFKKSFHNRSIHNAWVIANQFLHWPRSRPELSLLVAEGGLGPRWALAMKERADASVNHDGASSTILHCSM
jgi:hypothetical protein